MVGLSTQEQHPTKSSVRTFVQTLVPSLVLFVVVIPPIVQIVLDEVGKAGVELPSWLFAALTGAALACSLIASIAARVMAIPGVNDWLKRVGLGAEPRQAAAGGEIGPDH